MRHDYRRDILSNMAVGMADIQLSHNALATEIIVIYNDISVDHYQDSRIAEVDRVKKLAVFRKSQDMTFVPDDSEELLEDSEKSIPYQVLTTITGLPRMPRRDDMLLNEGVLYTIHHVKPMNRDIDGLIELIVYPERTTFIDPLNIYKLTLLDGNTLQPIKNLTEYEGTDEESDEESEEPVVMKDIVLDIVWGGNPTEYSFDNQNWLPFQSRIRFNLSEKELHRVLYVKGGMEIISQIVFS